MSYFDHFAKTKSTKIGDFLSREKLVKEFNFIRKSLPKNKNIEILEIGPGKGFLADIFIKSGYKKYDVIEPNNIMRKMLKEKGVRKSMSHLVPPLKVKNNSYDLIIAIDIFEHLNDTQEAILFVEEARRSLKKNGLIYIESPDLMNWGFDFWNCDFSHSNPTTPRRTVQIFYDNNINLVNSKYFYSCFDGFLGFLLNKIIKILIFSKGNDPKSKFYKLKLTFLARFGILGKK